MAGRATTSRAVGIGARIVSTLRDIGVVRLASATAASLGLGFVGLVVALSGIARNSNPSLVLKVWPSNGIALSTEAQLLFTQNAEAPSDAVKDLSLRALRSQALNPRALSMLGYYFSSSGQDQRRGEKFVDLAAEASRREASAQLWLVQRAATQNRISTAVDHLDILLRTKPNTGGTLFPIIVKSLPDAQFRRSLSRKFSPPSPWISEFLSYAISNSPQTLPVVDLVKDVGGFPPSPRAEGQASALMNRLSDEGRYTQIKQVYLFLPHASRMRFFSPEFEAADVESHDGLIGWQAFDNPDAGANFIRSGTDDRPQLQFYAEPETTRTVASKLLYLPPGAYTLTTQLSSLQEASGNFASWQFQCPTQRAETKPWSRPAPSGKSSIRFTVSSNCPVQVLSLLVSGGDGKEGVDATISRVSITSN
ncbi:hypothetical protein IDJ81_02410 [Tsuneonella flava]|uniref:Tetratricopeptide repeat protein n=1 Tax=Tsuneonella flava TaxID=2055955 RepID=A0ABX7K9V0_9SPHN|nr:hypothetical protein [Tsuneonella flava]QSB45038.1 hypothetical protein IDJ81_02410 [Tsuneonella flava]